MLAAWVSTSDHVVSLAGHARGDPPPGCSDEILGLLPREVRQRTGQDKNFASQDLRGSGTSVSGSERLQTHTSIAQPLDNMAVFLIRKELADALGDHWTNLVDLCQFLSTGRGQCGDRPVARRQQCRATLTDVANAQAKEQARQPALAAVGNGLDEVGGGFGR